jgi:DTW domain-containing protein YfiP
MSALTDAINTGVAVAGTLGGAIAFLWVRVERMNKRVKADLDACEDARDTQLIVIEIFWQELKRIAPTSATLKRAHHLLDEMRARQALRNAKGE